MADARRYLNARLDIDQILEEAKHRWLRPAEICEILQNYQKFQIGAEPPTRPSGGSLFLFDRKVLRYFRKDGHSWRKKKDGKTVKEAHERLKAGSIDVLHCYYAHGEGNENFQRRSYWMLQEELSHIVLVHYREVKANRTTFNCVRDAAVSPTSRQSEDDVSNFELDSAASSKFQPCDYQVLSQVTDLNSLNSPLASEYEDAESAYRHQASPGFQPIHELQPPPTQKMEVGSVPCYPVPLPNNSEGQFPSVPGMNFGSVLQGEKYRPPIDIGLTTDPHHDLEFSTWEGIVQRRSDAFQSVIFHPLLSNVRSSTTSMTIGLGNELLGLVVAGSLGEKREQGGSVLEGWQVSDRDSTNITKWPMNDESDSSKNLACETNYSPLGQPNLYDLTTKLNENNQVELSDPVCLCNVYPTDQIRHPIQDEHQGSRDTDNSRRLDPNGTNYPALRQSRLDGVREGLKKRDSFDRWMSRELVDFTESTIRPAPGAYWETVASEDGVENSGFSPQDNYNVAPSISQDQLYSILDFSPSWAYSGSQTKILVMGKFLRSQTEVENKKWACMFGEVEVPAEIIADGVLRCHTPLHETGRVPFYVTCCNRLACSEVREFEFQYNSVQDVDLVSCGKTSPDETLLHMRFGKLLTLKLDSLEPSVQNREPEISNLCNKIKALLKDDTEWEKMSYLHKQDEFSAEKMKDQLLQKLLKEKLHLWLVQKVNESGKGPSVLDEGGQGVLHFVAALGYDWAILPTVMAGVGVNFRDVNGWTALHWAAYYGRERTVATLTSLDAAPGALTDPTPEYPSGRTPYDLADNNGHKGISGYLAESTLSSHLLLLKLKDSKELGGIDKAVETVSQRLATPVSSGDLPHGLSLKDSLAALRNATQAAARIHQVFRAQSFQRKQVKEYGDSEYGISDERALSLLALKTNKGRLHNEPVHAAAICIQNKFRSWKGRKDFLLIRQHIIKIQAHVRGHQVRKNYKKIIWSVGILDKVILRWRRKGRGLSRCRHDALAASTSMQDAETKEDDYDFLKEGRKQTEERFQKALARVKSMVQYPEARDQYRRLLNVVSEMQEKKAAYDKILNHHEVEFNDYLINPGNFLEDDTFMRAAC